MRVTGGIGVGRTVRPRGAGKVEDVLSVPAEDSVRGDTSRYRAGGETGAQRETWVERWAGETGLRR